MGTVALAVGFMLLMAALAFGKKGLFERLESPLWILEDRLAARFEDWTGGSRRALRQTLIALAVLLTAAALGLTASSLFSGATEMAVSSLIVVGVMLFLSWWVDPVPSLAVRITTLGLILAYLTEAVIHALAQEWYDVVYSLAIALVRWTDYIIWADRQRPRKRREGETLPERFLRRIREAGLVPAPSGKGA